jgi:predicted transcriptional regulator
MAEENLSRRKTAKKLGVSPAWVSKHLINPVEKVPSVVSEHQ